MNQKLLARRQFGTQEVTVWSSATYPTVIWSSFSDVRGIRYWFTRTFRPWVERKNQAEAYEWAKTRMTAERRRISRRKKNRLTMEPTRRKYPRPNK